MAISPKAMADSLRKHADKRTTAEVGDLIPLDGDAWSFRLYDNDGGILLVRVSQYKDPIR